MFYLPLAGLLLAGCATQQRYPSPADDNYPGTQRPQYPNDQAGRYPQGQQYPQDTRNPYPNDRSPQDTRNQPPRQYPQDTRNQYPPQGQPPAGYPVTQRPQGDRTWRTGRLERPDAGITVNNIELTDRYTILDMTFYNPTRPTGQRDSKTGQSLDVDNISYDPDSYLIAGNGARTFRLVDVQGLPKRSAREQINQNNVVVLPFGQRLSFRVYYERLDRGLQQFDLFECQSDIDVCWNMHDLYVYNPAEVVQDWPRRPRTGRVGEVETPTQPQADTRAVQVTGTVRDQKTNRPVSATLTYQLTSSRMPFDSVQSFGSNGLYRITLPKGQVFNYTVSARGYQAFTEVLDLQRTTGGQNLTRDVYLRPLAVGDRVNLEKIYFEISKADLLPASYAELDKIVVMMQENPQMRIRLEGHTDVVGDKDANLELSQDRVDACKNYLMRQGIAATRIEAVGYGDARPIVKKGTDQERRVNRRVEFLILAV